MEKITIIFGSDHDQITIMKKVIQVMVADQ